MNSVSFLPFPVSVSLCLHTETELLIKHTHRERQNHIHLYIEQVKFGDSRQPTLSPFILLHSGGVMHQQRCHHRYLSLPSLYFLPFPPVFLLSHHFQSSSAFIFPVCSSAPFRSSSPPFFISCQMISETSLIPRPTPSSFPPADLSVFLYA